jgi:GNAT superfamily N-acetyltransferase
MALVRQVGWNQTAPDWMRFLRAQPDGCFGASVDGRLIASITTIIYEAAEAPPARRRLAWIGMLIVDAAHRGQGLGPRLLVRALDYLDRQRIACVKLDATAEGRQLYEKHGFVVEQAIERWELVRRSPPLATTGRRKMTPPLEDIVRLDRQLSGVDRGELLMSLAAEAPDLTLALREDRDPIGYACGRRGARADHLGPWMARDARAGGQVLQTFLERSDRPLVYVDCLTSNPWSRRLAEASGFRLSRPLTRMCRGANVGPGDTNLLGAIVGPEFG